jgi:ornithine cyclodeaminase
VVLIRSDGRPGAIVDGNYVTWIRTAAAGVIGTLALARADARRVLVVGNGTQAEAQVVAHAWGLSDRSPEFRVHAPLDRDGSKEAAFIARLARRGIPVERAGSLPTTALDSDIIVTATASTQPLLSEAFVAPGTHITAIGSDAPGKREIDDGTLTRAELVVDDRNQAALYGEAQYLPVDVVNQTITIGEILCDRSLGRTSDSAVTLFDSTGIGLHDLVTADLARATAIRAKAGTWVVFD